MYGQIEDLQRDDLCMYKNKVAKRLPNNNIYYAKQRYNSE